MKSKANQVQQVEIIHLSDLHFGKKHQFLPEVTPGGDASSSKGVRCLADTLREDWEDYEQEVIAKNLESGAQTSSRVVVCMTGDFAETGEFSEFKEVKKFIDEIKKSRVLDSGMRNVFMVPGNHDVKYDKEDMGERWQQFVHFYNSCYSANVASHEPWKLDGVYDRVDDLGVIVACLNSAIHVKKDSPDEKRGQVEEHQLLEIKARLKKIPTKRRESAIRIALIHHHPILVPTLVESNRGYDAVIRSGQLLSILREYGFHLVLHGHKHHPLTFPEDVRNAFEKSKDNPMLVVAGGSAGSTGLPTPFGVNCYNRITVKWHPGAGQMRIRVVTRGLVTHNPKTLQRLLTSEWRWKTLREDDRSFYLNEHLEKPISRALSFLPFDKSDPDGSEKVRKSVYAETRRNMPVVEVRPSFKSSQAFEATLWIVPHKPEYKGWELPEEVIWSAGPWFDHVIKVSRREDPRFCVSFDYWGPMLVQAEMRFADGNVARTHVYARDPRVK